MLIEIPPDVETHGDYYVLDRSDHETPWRRFTHVEIHRVDDESMHNWYDLYHLKNEIFGKNRAAIEVYPSASRLVDNTHSYHLWVLEEGVELPFGIHDDDPTNRRTVIP